MKKNLLTTLALALLATSAFAQNNKAPNNGAEKVHCGTQEPSQQWEAEMQKLVAEYKSNEATNTGKSQAAVYTIPVIFHIVHTGQAVGSYPNLAQGQINSQITVLNTDFGGNGYNVVNYPNTAFQQYAINALLPTANLDGANRIRVANVDIRFCLATQDTVGNVLTEPGIERIACSSKGWTNPTAFTSASTFQNYMNNTIKPQSIWNVKKYLNVWVTDCNGSVGLLGYATFPMLSTLVGVPTSTASGMGDNKTDGIWVVSNCIGSDAIFPAGIYNSSYTKGRTASHEVGHWLGFRHVWGDANCGSDFCSDTAPTQTSNFGAAFYPHKVNSCPSGSPVGNVNGEAFMNFMDYCDDLYMYMFSTDQKTRAQTAMTNSPYRNLLGTHGLCSVAAITPTAAFSMTTAACAQATVPVNNNSGGVPVASYSWSAIPSAGVVFNPSSTDAWPGVIFPSAGTYTVVLSCNGGVSTTQKVITVTSAPTVIVSNPSQTVCPNVPVTFNSTGATTYSWSNGGGTGANATYTPASSANYTVYGTTNGCQSAKVVVSVTTNTVPTITASATKTLICNGESTNATATGGLTYTWQPGNVTGSAATFSPATTTQYTVYGSGANGCNGQGVISVFVSPCTGIHQVVNDENFYSVYPNPTNGNLNIKLSNAKSTQLITVEVYDIIGKMIVKKSLVYNPNEDTNSIDISSLPAGSYLLKLASFDGIISKPMRVIKSN